MILRERKFHNHMVNLKRNSADFDSDIFDNGRISEAKAVKNIVKIGGMTMSKRGENIYLRKDGRWEGRIRISAPEKRLLSVYGKSYREVKEKLRDEKGRLAGNDGKESVGTEVFRWLTFKEKTLKASSVAKYRNLAKKHILPLLGNMKVSSLREETLMSFLRKVCEGQTNGNRSLSQKTVRDILMILKNSLCLSGKFVFPQIAVGTIPHAERRKKIRILSVAEQKKLEAGLLSSPDGRKAGLLLCLYAGLRIGEICALKWENIDLQEKILTVTSTLQRLQLSEAKDGKRTAVILSTPKSAESNRIVPIADFLIPILRKLKPKSSACYLLSGAEKYIEPRCYENYYKKILSEGGVPHCNFHALRHTFATRCIESGVDVKALSEMLGHSTVKLTLDRYVHPTIRTKQACINRMALSRQKQWSGT